MDSIIQAIDTEISRLNEVRSLLAQNVGSATIAKRGRKPGRPAKKAPAKAAKRVMSPEARARIAEAQRKRWAAQKKAK
jgi:hypothetical protein